MSIRAMEQAHLNLFTFHQRLDLGVSNMIETVTGSPFAHEPHVISYSQRDIDPKRYSRYICRTCTPSRRERLKESNHYSLFIIHQAEVSCFFGTKSFIAFYRSTKESICHSSWSNNLIVTACWYPDPHLRPSFEDILQALDAIVHSAFTQTPHESFHTMQEDWKLEIEEVLHGLRMKEKVSFCLV